MSSSRPVRRSTLAVAHLMFSAVLLASATNAVATPLQSGDIQPDFTLPEFGTTQQVDLHKDLSGKILVLDFFAYWCGPCRTASSELETDVQQYFAAHGGNPAHIPVQLVSVPIDDSSVSQTQSYLDTYGLKFVLDDPSWTLFNQYDTGYIPQFAIIDTATNTNHPQWQVLWTQTGYGSGDYTSFRNVIDSVTAVPEPSALSLLIAGGLAMTVWFSRQCCARYARWHSRTASGWLTVGKG